MGSVSTEIGRNGFPESMLFENNWRSYQARVLERLDSYLEDIRRIDQPTHVLAPTITIRDQWVDRLVGLFLPAGDLCLPRYQPARRQPANEASNVPQWDFGVAAIWAVLLLTLVHGTPVSFETLPLRAKSPSSQALSAGRPFFATSGEKCIARKQILFKIWTGDKSGPS